DHGAPIHYKDGTPRATSIRGRYGSIERLREHCYIERRRLARAGGQCKHARPTAGFGDLPQQALLPRERIALIMDRAEECGKVLNAQRIHGEAKDPPSTTSV